MIPDREKLTLAVEADEGSAAADVSVSLGLVVTELVINALKHAFPDGRSGHIVVGYRSRGPDWTLSVSDDGVGMATGTAPAKGGLGTSIVQALAKQLGAEIRVTNTDPGTSISLVRLSATSGAEPATAV
jgi:two-component sensor histidine kinase